MGEVILPWIRSLTPCSMLCVQALLCCNRPTVNVNEVAPDNDEDEHTTCNDVDTSSSAAAS